MKKIQLSIITLMTCSSMSMAGGDITPITPYEIEDRRAVEVISIVPAPIVITPPPVVVIPTPPPKPRLRPTPISSASVSPIYVGLGLAAGRYDSTCLNGPVGCDGVDKTVGVLVRAGYDFNKYMGIEARGLMTSYKANGGKIKHYGAFAKPMYPVTDGLNAYGLLGFAKTTTSGTLRNVDLSGLAFGAGLEYDLSNDNKKDAKYDREFDGIADQEKGFGIFADYERLYYKKNSPELDAVSVGVTYDF